MLNVFPTLLSMLIYAVYIHNLHVINLFSQIINRCVRGELEKMGQKYKLALKIIKDDRFERLPCMHKGTYADDCIVNRVTQHKCYIVATNDKDLKRRIRKIPGVPIMSVSLNRYTIERIGDSFEPMSSIKS